MSWIHVPRSYLSAPESEASTSDSVPADFAPWVTSSGTPTQRPSSWRGWKTRDWIKLLSGATYRHSTLERGAAKWISSLPVTHASRSASQATELAPMTSDTYGRTSCESSSNPKPPCSFARTSLDPFRLGSPTSSPTLPKAGLMRSGIYSARQTWAHRTGAKGCSSWPTAKVQTGDYQYSSGDHAKPVLNLEGAAKAWATPRARDDNRSPEAHLAWKARMGESHVSSLQVMAAMWATPRTSDTNGPGQHGDGAPDLRTQAATHGLQVQKIAKGGPDTSQKAVLNPSFVEALMGLPRDWTVCAVSETR